MDLDSNGSMAMAAIEPGNDDPDPGGFNASDEESMKSSKSGKSSKSSKGLVGINDLAGYEEVTRKFVGLNPKLGAGSGFIVGDITAAVFPVANPASGGPRVDLCTCDCVAGDDGVGCVGWGGVAFRYSSALWKDPLNGVWTGQIQAYQKVDNGELNFLGTDTRLSPGGAAIYNVACTDSLCDGLFSGVFRQSNGPVSCVEGLADKEANESYGCFERCGNADTYLEWLDYCDAEDEDKSLGFSGYGI